MLLKITLTTLWIKDYKRTRVEEYWLEEYYGCSSNVL